MISFLQGTVESIHADSIIVLTHGVGRRVYVSPELLTRVHHGEEVGIHTELIVREDALTLFGFASPHERDTFIALQSTTGVGPKLAMAVLAVLSPDEVSRAVAEGDRATLTRVPGIGPKVASRLLLELSGRLHAPADAAQPVPGPAIAEVTQALVGLGWKESQVEPIVEAVAAEAGEADVRHLLKASLAVLGKKR